MHVEKEICDFKICTCYQLSSTICVRFELYLFNVNYYA